MTGEEECNLLQIKAEKEIAHQMSENWAKITKSEAWTYLIRGKVEGVARAGNEWGNDPSFSQDFSPIHWLVSIHFLCSVWYKPEW